jgi:hypothetical protein
MITDSREIQDARRIHHEAELHHKREIIMDNFIMCGMGLVTVLIVWLAYWLA